MSTELSQHHQQMVSQIQERSLNLSIIGYLNTVNSDSSLNLGLFSLTQKITKGINYGDIVIIYSFAHFSNSSPNNECLKKLCHTLYKTAVVQMAF